MSLTLNASAVRVLGALMEKEMTTPDQYPLSINALLTAANQRSSRDPVMELTEDEVRTAVHGLQDLELVAAARDGSRVARFEHRIRTVLALRRDETALLCVLLLRGPQTPGELRGRAERMFGFDDLAAVQGTLDRMGGREVPLVVALARSPGSREVRYAHLLGGPVVAGTEGTVPREAKGPTGESVGESEELAALRAIVQALELRVLALESRRPGPGSDDSAAAGEDQAVST